MIKNYIGITFWGIFSGRADPGNDRHGEVCFFISSDADDVESKNRTVEHKEELATKEVGVTLESWLDVLNKFNISVLFLGGVVFLWGGVKLTLDRIGVTA